MTGLEIYYCDCAGDISLWLHWRYVIVTALDSTRDILLN